ncbi:Translin family [Seminavis robusta]|uniref:Translin family n=1 Tax=Seminavis robusta TaxID=568900 RepID=A0A9N8DMZ6_9STRA|nr:Translin family [Seminavis robusta]|eukprot:Sro169_g075100.1 Translin family (474) ;mRNA; f:43079-44500
MPARPYSFLPEGSTGLLDLSKLGTDISDAEDKRQAGFDAGRNIKAALVAAKATLESGKDETDDSLEKLIIETVGAKADRSPREANLHYQVEDFVRHQAFLQFLKDATLLPPSATPYATDEEYLAGACMGLAQDLAKYGIGRATIRDAESVNCAKVLVGEILGYLLQFDFRNGPLRRKYDGTKYALKTLETLLYELAVTGTSVSNAKEGGEKPAKLQKTENEEPSKLLAHDELKELRERMEHRDALRETLIKRCRDGQKAAKQAIFALHRGDPKKAKTLIDQCEECVKNDLLPIVHEEPPLKYGSFSNMLEEYCEAKLFYAWLFGDTTKVPDDVNNKPSTTLLKKEELLETLLGKTDDNTEPDYEIGIYLGGICDLTGEIGRFAVQQATLRDEECVKLSLQTNKSILSALQMMGRSPRDIGKKMGALEKSVEKIERILYEMSLSEAAGGRNVQTSTATMDVEPEGKAMDSSSRH